MTVRHGRSRSGVERQRVPANKPARPATRNARARRRNHRDAPLVSLWRSARAWLAADDRRGLILLALASLLAYLAQAGMSERLRTTWHLANAYDFAVSRTMPLAALFRAAVAWVPRRLPGVSSPSSPFLMAMLGDAATLAVLFALYALALRHIHSAPAASSPTPAGKAARASTIARGQPRSLRERVAGARPATIIALSAALFSTILLFTPAAPSHDPFAYAMSGRLLLAHRANPFFTVPAAYPHDPILASDEWRNSITAYGPLWTVLSVLLAPIIGDDPLRANMVYRLVAYAAHLANLALIAGLLSRLPARHARWREHGLLLYAWNPLVVIEVAAGHNDVLMLTFLLLGLFLLQRGHQTYAMIALAASILIKASAVPLVLIVLLALWLATPRAADQSLPASAPESKQPARSRHPALSIVSALVRPGRAFALDVLVVAGVVVAGLLPFYWGHSLAEIAATSRLQPSSQSLAKTLTSSFSTLASGIHSAPFLPAPLAAALARVALILPSPTFWTLVLAVALLVLTFFLLPSLSQSPRLGTSGARDATHTTPERLPAALAWIYAAWMVFLCVFLLLRTWYLIPLVGLACLVPMDRPIRRFTMTLTAALELQVFFLSKSPPFDGWQPWTAPLILGIPVLVLAIELRRAGFSWRAAAQASAASLRERVLSPTSPRQP